MKKYLLLVVITLFICAFANAQVTPHKRLLPSNSQQFTYKNELISLQYSGAMQKYEENEGSKGYYCATFTDMGKTQIKVQAKKISPEGKISNFDIINQLGNMLRQTFSAKIGQKKSTKLAGLDAMMTDYTYSYHGIDYYGTIVVGSNTSVLISTISGTIEGENDELSKNIQESIRLLSKQTVDTPSTTTTERFAIGSFDIKRNDDASSSVLNPEHSLNKQNESIDEDKIYDVTLDMPSFIGGHQAQMEYISQNLKYPEQARKDGIQGRVVVSFVVEKDGSLSNFKCVRSIHPLLDAEAIRLVRLMPKWKPGTELGKPVRVKYNIPIAFKLN